MEIKCETIGAYKTYGDECIGHSNKPNRNMTLTSLIAFFDLLNATTSEDFCANYILAFHDNNGKSIWNLIVNTEKYDEVRRQRMREKYQIEQEKKNAKLKKEQEKERLLLELKENKRLKREQKIELRKQLHGYVEINGRRMEARKVGKRHWYNNGEVNKLYSDDDVPEGWTIGWIGNWGNQYKRGTK